MAWLWKVRAQINHGIGKIIYAVLFVALILGGVFVVRNLHAIWKILDDLMTY
jgi:uncharacterized protein YoxC